MKGEKFTADNPTPKPGKRTTLLGTPIPDDFFENESDEAAVLESEANRRKTDRQGRGRDRRPPRRRRLALRQPRILAPTAPHSAIHPGG